MATKKKTTSWGQGSGIYDPDQNKKKKNSNKSSESTKKSTSTKTSGGVSSSKKTTDTSSKNTTKSTTSMSGGSGIYDSSTKKKINSTVNQQTSSNTKTTSTKKETSTKKDTTKNTNKSTTKSIETKVNTNLGSSYDTKTGKRTNGSALGNATKERNKSSVQKTQDKLAQRQAKIGQNHESLSNSSSKAYKTGKESIDSAIQSSVDQANKRYGNKTSTSDVDAVATKQKLVNAGKTIGKASKKQLQTITENFQNSELREQRVRESHQAISDLSDANTALSRNGQVSNPTWKNKTVNKINLNDATQLSKINKKATESTETIQKSLDANPYLKAIGESNASFQKGVENAVSSGLQFGGQLGSISGRLMTQNVKDKLNNSVENSAGAFVEEIRSASAAADQAMRENNSIYATDFGQAMSSVGNMLPQTLLGAGLGMAGVSNAANKAATLGLMGANVFGSSATQAKHDYLAQDGRTNYSDLTDDEFTRANIYALLSAGKEVGSELLDKLIPGVNKLNINDLIGEGLEEVVGGLAEPYINQVLTADSVREGLSEGTNELKESITSGDLLKQGLMGSASAAIANTPYTISSVARNSQYVDANGKQKTSLAKGVKETVKSEIENAKANRNAKQAQFDYDMNKANAKITGSKTAQENIKNIQQEVTHLDGEVSDYMTNNSDEYTKQFAQGAQSDMIRTELKTQKSSKEINRFLKEVNEKGYAVEFTDGVEINGQSVDAKGSSQNGITIDRNAIKDTNLNDLLNDVIEKGYSVRQSETNAQEGVAQSQEMGYSVENNAQTEGDYGTVEHEFRELQEASRRRLDGGSWQEGSYEIDEGVRNRLSDVSKRWLGDRGYDNSNDNGLLKNTGDFKIFKDVDAETFHDLFETNKPYIKYQELVDLHDTGDYTNNHNYISDDGMAGFSITQDGDLISVFNNSHKRGFLRSIADTIKSEAKTLDCYALNNKYSDNSLPKMYEKVFGFKRYKESSYDMQYDHDNIAFMVNPKYANELGINVYDSNATDILTNEQKNQILQNRKKADIQKGETFNWSKSEQDRLLNSNTKLATINRIGEQAFAPKSPFERQSYIEGRVIANELNERVRKAVETNDTNTLASELNKATTDADKQTVKEGIKESVKKATEKMTGEKINDETASTMSDVVEDVLKRAEEEATGKAHKGVEDAAKGKHGETEEEQANFKEEVKYNDSQYEQAHDELLDQTSRERLDSFKKDGKFTYESAQEILDDVKSRADKIFKIIDEGGRLSNYHQYEQAYMANAYTQVSDIVTGYRAELEKQGYTVKSSIENGKITFTVTDSKGNIVNNETTQALQSSGLNAQELRHINLKNASVAGAALRNFQRIWKDASKEEKIYEIQELVDEVQKYVNDQKMNKNGNHILEIDSDLLADFESAENNSKAQAEAFDAIVKQLARDTPRKFTTKLATIRNMSMLLSIPTNLRNIVGNLTMQGLGKSSNLTTSLVSKALQHFDWYQTNEVDLSNSQNMKFYEKGKELSSEIMQKYLSKEMTAEKGSRLAKDIKKWKGGANHVDQYFYNNDAFTNRLYQNLAYRLSEMSNNNSEMLTDAGEVKGEWIESHKSELNQMFSEAYEQSRKARALQSENAWTRSDGTIARATSQNLEVAKTFLSEAGGEEGVTGGNGGRVASGDRVVSQEDSSAFKRYKEALQSETFIGRESKLIKKYFGKDVNVGILHNQEKLTNWALNNGIFGDSAFFRQGYAREWARYIDAQGYSASATMGEDGYYTYTLTDSKGNILNQSQTQRILNKANEYSIIEAQELVFHQYSQLAQNLNAFNKGDIFGKILKNAIMPFAKTPINIAKNSVEYSPIGLIRSLYDVTAGVSKGEITSDQAIRHLTKGMTGSAIMGLGAFMFANGMLNATGDDEDKYEQNQGKQDYSLNLPNGTYTLSWLSVANVPLFMGAQVAKQLQDGGFSLEDAVSTVMNMADPIINTSFMSGLVDTLREIGGSIDYDDDDSQSVYNIASSLLKTYISQYFPSWGKHLVTVMNQYKKSTYSDTYTGGILNSALTSIPLFASQLPNQVDVNGEDIENAGGDNALYRALFTYLSIGTYKEYDKTYGKEGSSYDNTLTKISKVSGDSSILPYVSSSLNGVKMNKQERHDLNQYMLKNYKEQANKLFNSALMADYDLDNKEDATELASLLKSIKSYYYYKAQEKLYQRVSPSEASSVLSTSSKAISKLEDNGIDVYLSTYLKSREQDVDYNGNTISNSKQLRNRELLEKMGLYDKVVNLYENGTIDDLYNIGLSSSVVKMSEEQYISELDDIVEGIAEGNASTSASDRRDATFDDLEENQAFADVLTNHNISWSQFSKYTDIEYDKDEDGNTVTGSRAKKIIAAMEEDGTLESFKAAIEDGTINYDNITKFHLTSSSVKKLLGLTVQSGDSSSSSSSSSSTKSSSSSSKKFSSSKKSSSSSKKSSSSSSDDEDDDSILLDFDDALSSINKSASKTSSSLTQSQLQSLYNSIVSNHKSKISSLQTLVDKGKK